MKNWTIGRRLVIGFAAVVTVAIALGGFAYSRLLTIRENTATVADDALPGVQLMGDITSVSKDIRGAILQHMLTTRPEEKAALDAKIQASVAAADKDFKAYEPTMTTSQERDQYARIKSALADYRDVRENVVLPLSRQGKNAEAFEKFQTVLTPVMQKYFAALDAVVQYNSDDAKRMAAETGSAVSSASAGILIGLIVAVLVGAGVAFVIVSSTNKSLSTALASLSEGAQQVVSASSQVATSAQSLSQGATEQAASLEETSASMEEMASMTRRNAENSQTAAGLMAEVDVRVRESNQALGDMVSSMAAIQDSSQKVGKIIKTIDEIAFQTNILALNAAVEAARAGEAGMGFAVVADEVRNLAQRSAQAAKDTAGLIEESIGKAQSGTQKVEQVVVSIGGITESVSKVKGLVDDVSQASRQQTQGIDQVSQAIAQMEKVTQTTAATAEESAAASEELNAQAETSLSVVAALRALVGGAGDDAQPRPSASRAGAASKIVKLSRAARPAAPVAANEAELPLEGTGTYGRF